MSCSRTQHGGGRFRTPDLSLRSPTLYHWATALPVYVSNCICLYVVIKCLINKCLLFNLLDYMLFDLNLAPKDAILVVCDGKCVFPVHSHCANRQSAKLINFCGIWLCCIFRRLSIQAIIWFFVKSSELRVSVRSTGLCLTSPEEINLYKWQSLRLLSYILWCSST